MQCSFHLPSYISYSTLQFNMHSVMKIYSSNIKGCQKFFGKYFKETEIFYPLLVLNVETWNYSSSHNFEQWHSIYAQFHAKSCMHKCCVLSIKSFYQTINYLTWINLWIKNNFAFHQIFRQLFSSWSLKHTLKLYALFQWKIVQKTKIIEWNNFIQSSCCAIDSLSRTTSKSQNFFVISK